MKKIFWLFRGALLGLVAAVNVFAADVYTIDPAHSEIGFAVKHLTVSTVRGNFKDFAGTIQLDPADPASLSAEATIQAASIDTNAEGRDTHLKSIDFFDTETYPTITFKSTGAQKEGEEYILTGDLTMHGVTKQVTIPLSIAGPVKGMKEAMVIGLSGDLSINRQDYGISWNKTLDTGGLVVSDDVRITVNLEAKK